MEINLTVPSITCSVCSGRIKDELSGMEGVSSVDVDLKTQSVKVSYNPDLQKSESISKKITDMGYEVVQ